MDSKYQKNRPRDLYLSILPTEISEADRWTGTLPNQWGNRASGNDFIDLFAGLIRKHRHNTVEYYAKLLGVEYKSFIGAIDAMCGIGVRQFIHEYLNLIACELLQNTEMSMQEIAKELHFSPVTFSRFFRNMNKCQPYEWRSQYQYGARYRYRP